MKVGNTTLRSISAVLLGALVFGTAQHALAISPENREALKEHFRSLGSVSAEIYAPLGGPEIGVAQIGEGSGARLHAIRVAERGAFETLLSEPLSIDGGAPPFAFIHGGTHLLTYNSDALFTTAGQQRRGDIVIHDVVTEGAPKKLFELRGLVDASYQIGMSKFQDNMVWQPAPHFLNDSGRLPVKSQYARMLWDDITGEYRLTQHLTALPDAETIPSANLNNKAIIYYRAGRLADAELLFSEASQLAGSSQSLILHNNELVSSEISDLERQRRLAGPERPFDDALMYYWQGRYKDALRALQPRFEPGGAKRKLRAEDYAGRNDFDLALLCLALAQAGRWPEVDKHLAHLAQSALYAETVGELTRIARLQNHDPVPEGQTPRERFMRLLEQVDPTHPQLAVALAVELVKLGREDDAQQVLVTNLRGAAGRDVSDTRLMLFELYQRNGGPSDILLNAAGSAPLSNVYALSLLADYVDLSSARLKVGLDEMTTVKVDGRLEGLSWSEKSIAE